jgi:colanic acid/amylovoran biosynthesis glycosyltransferase
MVASPFLKIMTNRMPIAYIVGEFPSNTEYFIQEEIKALEKEGFDIVIFAYTKRGDRNTSSMPKANVFYPSGFGFTFLLAYFWAFCYAWKRISAVGRKRLSIRLTASDYLREVKCLHQGILFAYAIRRAGCYWIHAHFLSFPATLAQLVSQFTRLPFSLSAHANDIYTGIDLPAKIQEAEFIVTCNERNKSLLIRAAMEQKAESKIHIVYHGIDPSAWPFVEVVTKRAEDPVRILCVARLIEKKGIRHLIEAVHILVSKGRNVSCTIVGEGELRRTLEAHIHRLDLQGNIELLGARSRSDVARLLRNSDVFVLACVVAENGDRDGVPNVLLEAMATGVPVVTTPVGAITELVKPALTGILVPEQDSPSLAQAIEAVLDDPAAHVNMKTTARRFIETNFDIRRSTTQLANLFSKTTTGWEA